MLRDTLGSLPATLNGQYAQILGNIHTNHRKLAVKAFQWVIHSNVPIYVDELMDVLATDVAAEPRFSPKRRLVDREDLFRICSYLIDVSPRNRRVEKHEHNPVRFAHLSVKEYLLSDQLLASPIAEFAPTYLDAHALIARDCLSYLLHANKNYGMEARNLVTTNGLDQYDFTMSDFINQYEGWKPCGWPEQIDQYEKELKAALPLIFYAAEFWAHHARIAEEQDGELFQLMIEAFEPGTFDQWTSFVDLRWNSCMKRRDVFGRGRLDRLTYAIDMQLLKMVQHLLQQGVDVHTDGSETLTPMQAAAESGNLELVKTLIKFGANVNLTASAGGTPLSIAANRGDIEVVELLLVEGADVNLVGAPKYPNTLPTGEPKENYSKTPLMAAASGNHVSVARILIGKGANVQFTTGHEFPVNPAPALHFATICSNAEMVQLLLSHGALSNPDTHITAFRIAVYSRRVEGARLLLEAGIGVNTFIPSRKTDAKVISRDCFETALQIASRSVNLPMVELLLRWGADVNLHTNSNVGTALQAASLRGSERLIELLIQAGANVNLQVGSSGSAIHAACSLGNGGYPSVVRLLIEHGADIHLQGGKYGSPLRTAASCNNTAIISVLLENGADVNQRVENGGSALEAALEKGHGRAAHLLLAASADRTVRDELLPRLQDVYRGIDDLSSRERVEQITTEDGEIMLVKGRRSPDGIYGLPDYC
ncbi:MAG: hypothetical protein Q9204_007969 [Flavoplaca sp. TL-2023a]